MTESATLVGAQQIVVDEMLPHAPEIVWKTLTTPELMGRWLMIPTGFEARKGARFTYKTTPAGPWDGTIQCEVLEVRTNERLAYSWKGGHDANPDYGSRLDTVVTWTLAKVEGGTRLRLVHSGFELPRNAVAFLRMGEGWPQVVEKVGVLSGEDAVH